MMLINGRTPEEIKAGLRACTTGKTPGYGCNAHCPYLNVPNCWLPVKADAIALIEHLEAKAPKWISVEEQEPVFPCLYWDGVNAPAVAKSLVAITLKDGKKVFVADALLEMFPEALQGLLENCTHILYWMPLPEPPKGEDE